MPTPKPPLAATGRCLPVETDSGSIQRQVHSALKAMIADGRLRPGERLIEQRVAAAFGVSRSPIRATLAALCRERALRKADGRGYLVSGPSPVETLGRLATLDVAAIQPAPLWERVYAEVESTLARHVLFRSVRLIEERLAAHFGVSRTVARDVLGRMHAVGLVGKDRLGRWQVECLTPQRIRHLYELRWLLEPAALRQTAPQLERDRLLAIAGQMRACARAPTDDGATLDRLEQALHVDLIAACPNRELIRALEPTRLLLVLNRYLMDLSIPLSAQVAGSTMNEHLEVVLRLIDGDLDGASTALEHHLRRSNDLWQVRYREAETAARSAPLPPWLLPAGGHGAADRAATS